MRQLKISSGAPGCQPSANPPPHTHTRFPSLVREEASLRVTMETASAAARHFSRTNRVRHKCSSTRAAGAPPSVNNGGNGRRGGVCLSARGPRGALAGSRGGVRRTQTQEPPESPPDKVLTLKCSGWGGGGVNCIFLSVKLKAFSATSDKIICLPSEINDSLVTSPQFSHNARHHLVGILPKCCGFDSYPWLCVWGSHAHSTGCAP